jgi:hypothetical protein
VLVFQAAAARRFEFAPLPAKLERGGDIDREARFDVYHATDRAYMKISYTVNAHNYNAPNNLKRVSTGRTKTG